MSRDNSQPTNQVKSNFFYGYVIVIAAFFIMLVSWAIFGSYGVFFKPLQDEFGWSSAQVSGPISLSMIIYGVLGIVVGVLNDKLGPRIVITICGVLLGAGYLLMSQANSLWQIYLFTGVLAGVGLSGVWVPQLSTIARWFIKRRSLMTGIVVAGMGISQLIGPLLISRMIEAYDWRFTYLTLGGVVLVVMVIAAQFLRRDPFQIGQLPYGGTEIKKLSQDFKIKSFSLKEAVQRRQFWITIAMYICYGFCGFTLTVHIVPHAIKLGFSALTAAAMLATMGGAGIIGNYFLGGLGDRIGNKQVFSIGFILMIVAYFWLVTAKDEWTLYLLAGLTGLSMGGLGTAESPLVAWLFGLKSHGLIYGIAHCGFTIGAAAGPVLVGYLVDIKGDYRSGFFLIGIMAVMGLILSIALRPLKKAPGIS